MPELCRFRGVAKLPDDEVLPVAELCRFRGVVIRIHSNDHPPPHFHALYAGFDAFIEIDSLAVTHGLLPGGVRRRVLEWAALHQDELRQAWERRASGEPIRRIAPPN